MKKLNPVFLLVLAICFIGAKNPKIKVTPLFDGKNLSKWTEIKPDTTHIKNPIFRVENGTIRAYGKTPAFLVTKKSFKNYFKLSLQYRWNSDSTYPRLSSKRNSGIMYNVPVEDNVVWPKGIQFQIKENATGDFILMKEVTLKINGVTTQPGKNTTVKRTADKEKPVGEWNILEIIFDHGHCSQFLNGTLVNEGFESSVTDGRILLQYEGFPIDFKDITIEYTK
jgi:hypothetical protein